MKLSLRNKFLIPTILLIIVGMSIVTSVSYFMSKNALNEIMTSQVIQQAESTVKFVNAWIEDRKLAVVSWGEQKIYQSAVEDSFVGKAARKLANDQLAKLKQDYTGYEDIHLATITGEVVASSNPDVIEKLNVSMRKYFQESLNGNVNVSDVMESETSGNPVFMLSTPVKQAEEVIGVLFGVVDLNYFNAQFIDPIRVGTSGYAYMYMADGLVVAHPDPANILTLNIASYDWGTHMIEAGEGRIVYTWEGAERLVVFRKIRGIEWTIGLGILTNELFAPVNRIRIVNIAVAIIIVLLSMVSILFWVHSTVGPIKHLAETASQLAEGDIECDLREFKTHDEVGILSGAFKNLITYIQEMASAATAISQGDLSRNVRARSDRDVLGQAFLNMSAYLNEMATAATAIAAGDLRQEIQPKTEEDVLGNAFQHLIAYVRNVTDVAEKISAGDLHIEVTPKSDQDILNISLQRMVTNLQAAREKIEMSMAEVEQQNWLKTGQTELNQKMRGEQDVVSLAYNIITYLAGYVEAQVGAIYLVDDEEQLLRLVGSYAYTDRKGNRNEIKLGKTLVGQAALEKHSIVFTDVPDDYIKISSGLGDATPQCILVSPFLYQDEVKGVIELGSVRKFGANQREFLEQIMENIAIAFHSAQSRVKMRELLEETQRQSETLQVQQEELRQTNEELGAQTQALRASEEKLQTQQEELRQTNDSLEKQARTLEQQKQELAKNNRELERAQKLVEEKAKDLEISSKYKSEFLANMSHELRTPLNSLLILSKVLSENKDGNLTEKQVEFAQTIYGAGSDLLELINEVLDLSKIEAGKMMLNIEAMNLNRLSKYIEQHFTHMAEAKGLTLNMTLDENVPATIHTDRQRVEQILKNLLSNAMKFTSKGGITVDVKRPAASIDLSRSGLEPRNALAISVSDTGLGIPEEKQRLIFEAFQQADGTTSRKYGGTGLGLSITRELSKLLGGEIHLRSKEGEGSTFTFYLPEILAETPETRQETDVPPLFAEGQTLPEIPPIKHTRPGGVETIRDDRHDAASPEDRFLLIVEDDSKFAKVLFELAREKGFKGLIAQDGAAGLQLAYQYIPDAMILDVGLPGMNGLTVMEKLKQNPDTRHIPVHFISASDQSLDAMKMGAIGYLTKPVSIDKLHEAFQTIETSISRTIKKLLVVEDDEAARKSMLELLRGDDVTITTAETGEDAQRLLNAEAFDCMVLDLGLKDISGFELLEKIKQEPTITPLPIIVYTGKDLTKDEEMRLNKHAESIIIKGVRSPERLLDEVALFLHRVTAELPETQRKQLRMLHDNDQVLSDKTILMADDDMRNLFALSSALEETGIAIRMAENGKDAIALLEKHGDIDLVLMDIMMPEMDGYETISRIRKHTQFNNLPIIALTAKAMKGDRQKCIEAGANDYLSKPVDLDKLLSLLRVWLY